MSAAYLTMSHRELDRSEVMHRLLERRLSHRQAAVMLGLSTRQCERLFARYKRAGPQALVSQKRGRASNRKLPEDQRTEALELVRRHYADFGPTLAHEKLVEQHGLDISVTTLRRWMTEDGLWQTRSQKLKRA